MSAEGESRVSDAVSRVMELPSPYLLFLGDTTVKGFAKTAFGLRDWAAERCVGEWSCDGNSLTTGLARLTPQEARSRGARALVIGVANPGGAIGAAWIPYLIDALESGLDLISGMHSKLGEVPALQATAARLGRRLIDVRTPPPQIPIATGRKRTGQRLLTVGTDCAIGKKYAALALARALAERGVPSHFRASGQTGILIAGGGIPMDAVVADFEAGAAELLSPDAPSAHWDVIEGQGSLFHPAYAAVALGLLHGSQPDVIVVCHEPGREHMLGYPGYRLPSLEETIELNLYLARRINPAVRCAGVNLNTSSFEAEAANRVLREERERLGLPVADVMRGGEPFETLVDACLHTHA